MKGMLSQFFSLLKERLARSWLLILIVFVVMFGILAGGYILQNIFHIPAGYLTRDTNQVARLPVYTGIVSNLGWMLWAATVACVFMGSALLRGSNPRKARFLLLSGVFTAWIALDDMLQFHEEIFPKLLHVPEKLIYVVYLAAMIGILLYFIRDILSDTDFPILMASLLFLGCSILVDAFSDHVYVEDSTKFLGVIFWLIYYSRTVFQLVKQRTIPEKQAGKALS